MLTDNKSMQAVVNKSNCKVSSKLAGNVYSYQMDFEYCAGLWRVSRLNISPAPWRLSAESRKFFTLFSDGGALPRRYASSRLFRRSQTQAEAKADGGWPG